MTIALPIHGRGTADNPPNRFESISVDDDYDHVAPEERVSPETSFFHDETRTIIARNDSPDIPFDFSLNPYRGCEHGCIYCFARPSHEYLSLSAGLDFETKIFVKREAPRLLRRELMLNSWKPSSITLSGVTDCYQPAERLFRLTRGCLEVLLEFRNPASIITKSALVTRDIDILSKMAGHGLVEVYISVTTLDNKLASTLEPRAAAPQRRLDTIARLSDAGISVGVMVAPIIPGLTDHETASILKAAANAGAKRAGFVPLRLPFGVKTLFETWIQTHYPDRAGKVLNRVRDLRGGRLNDPNFGTRMRGQGAFADHMKALFALSCKKYGLNEARYAQPASAFRRPGGQLDLF